MVTHQLQVRCRPGKVRRSDIDVLPLGYTITARCLILQVYNKPGWCKMFSYMTYVSSFLSVWFVIIFSFERYLAIQFPLKRHILCRPRRAWMVVISITGLALLLYNFALWTSVVEVHHNSSGGYVHVCQVRPLRLPYTLHHFTTELRMMMMMMMMMTIIIIINK